MNVNGVWTLNISDRVSGDIGSFTGFSISGTGAAVVPESGTVALMAAGMGLAGVVLRRKR